MTMFPPVVVEVIVRAVVNVDADVVCTISPVIPGIPACCSHEVLAGLQACGLQRAPIALDRSKPLLSIGTESVDACLPLRISLG